MNGRRAGGGIATSHHADIDWLVSSEFRSFQIMGGGRGLQKCRLCLLLSCTAAWGKISKQALVVSTNFFYIRWKFQLTNTFWWILSILKLDFVLKLLSSVLLEFCPAVGTSKFLETSDILSSRLRSPKFQWESAKLAVANMEVIVCTLCHCLATGLAPVVLIIKPSHKVDWRM